jgi:hypothetical protein
MYKCVFKVETNEVNSQSILNYINYLNDCTIKNTFVNQDSSVSSANRYG